MPPKKKVEEPTITGWLVQTYTGQVGWTKVDPRPDPHKQQVTSVLAFGMSDGTVRWY